MTMLIGHLLYLAVLVPVVALLAVRFARVGRDLLVEVGEAPASAAATSGALAGVALLLDVGAVLWLLSSADPVTDPVAVTNLFAMQVGVALLLLGMVHLTHLMVLVGIRNGRRDRELAAARLHLPPRPGPAWPQPSPQPSPYGGPQR